MRALVCLVLAACGSTPPPEPLAAPPPPTPELTRAAVLQWTDSEVVVDARWRLKVDTGTFAPLGPKAADAIPALSPTGLAAVFEPGMVTVLGGRQVKVP